MIDIPGTPSQVFLTCAAPAGYPSTWHYGIWNNYEPLLGTHQLKTCINPKLCRDEIPNLPLGGTVEATFNSYNIDRTTGARYKYVCAYNSKSKGF